MFDCYPGISMLGFFYPLTKLLIICHIIYCLYEICYYICIINILIMENIKELRKEKGLTQENLAKLTGLSFVTINRAEKTGKMRLSTYMKIINALKND